jgi:hypothetical protein
MNYPVHGLRLSKGARVGAAADLDDADSQLALRMLSCNPTPLWRSLSLHGVTYEAYNGPIQHPAQGTLVPIVETELGEPIVAAWVSPDAVERRYVVPARRRGRCWFSGCWSTPRARRDAPGQATARHRPGPHDPPRARCAHCPDRL